MANTWTSSKLFAAIEAAHPAPEWAVLGEVANGTGSNVRRHADAIAMSLWPSRGLLIRGFEIKVSKSDYRRESRDPMKAEEIAAFVDEWWIVTPPGLLDLALELPPAWGLMEPSGAKLCVTRRAERTEAKPLTRSFVAAILRGAQKQVVKQREGWIRREEIESEIEKARKDGEANAPIALRREQDELIRYQKAVATFAEATGIAIIDGWREDAKALGEAVRVGKALLGNGWNGVQAVENRLRNEIHSLTTIANALGKVIPED